MSTVTQLLEAFSNSDVLVAFFGALSGIIATICSYKGLKYKNNKQEEIKKRLMINHHFFNSLDILVNEVNNNFHFKNKGKELLCKEIVTVQMKDLKQGLLRLAQNVDNGHIQDEEHLYNTCLIIFNKNSTLLHRFYKESNNYTDDEARALEIVIFKYENWTSGINDIILDNIRMCCYSSSYKDIPTKCSVILDMYLSTIFITTNIAEKTICSLNGDLRGMIFKGVTI